MSIYSRKTEKKVKEKIACKDCGVVLKSEFKFGFGSLVGVEFKDGWRCPECTEEHRNKK